MSDSGQEIGPSFVDRLGDRWEAGWAGRGRDEFALCCTVDIRYEDPLTDGLLDGVDQLESHVMRLRTGMPDMRVERSGVRISQNGFACLPWRIVGTQKGPIGELPATGKFVTLYGVHYVELRDDLICRARGFFDLHDAATQLGLLPKQGSLAQSALLMLRGFGLRSRS